LVTSPVEASKSIPESKVVNTPPVSPVMVAVAPSQVAVIVNDASSSAGIVTVSVLVVEQVPTVVYVTV
jgi:hypothetical protein